MARRARRRASCALRHRPFAARAPGEPSSSVVAWLAERLTTRAAWERHGFEVASSLVAARAFSELGEIIAVVVSRTAREEPSRGAPAVLAAIQASFALTLVEAARAAVVVARRPARGGCALGPRVPRSAGARERRRPRTRRRGGLGTRERRRHRARRLEHAPREARRARRVARGARRRAARRRGRLRLVAPLEPRARRGAVAR